MTNQIEPRRPIPPAPIHPLAALATIALDAVFGIFDFTGVAILFTSISAFVLGTVTTTLVQHYLAKENWGPSVAKGFVMGILAGVPFQVVGTVVGVPLLVWAGLHEWIKLPQPPRKAPTLPPDEIIDVEVKEVKEVKEEK